MYEMVPIVAEFLIQKGTAQCEPGLAEHNADTQVPG